MFVSIVSSVLYLDAPTLYTLLDAPAPTLIASATCAILSSKNEFPSDVESHDEEEAHYREKIMVLAARLVRRETCHFG